MLKPKGFTLFEILIVLAIIAIMSGIAVLNVGSSNYSKFLSDANKISNLFELISDQAVYTNSVISCDIATEGLSCQSYKNNEWTDLKLTKIASWQWPQNIKVRQVIINGLPLKEGEKLRFFPNGNNYTLSIEITNGAYHTWIDNDLSDNFKVSN